MGQSGRRIRPMKLTKQYYSSILPTVSSIIVRSAIGSAYQTDWTVHKATHFPLQDCSLILHLLEKEGFLKQVAKNLYSVKEFVILHCDNCSEKYDPTTAKSIKDIDQWLSTTKGRVKIKKTT